MKRYILISLVCLSVVACSGGARTTSTPVGQTGGCTIPPRTYDDLQSCNGDAEEIGVDVADSFQPRTMANIVISSKDPQAILAGMGAYAAQRGVGTASFDVSAYGSREDYDGGVGYNRGRIAWTDGGEISVYICTEYETWSGIDMCAEESHYTVANK